MAVRQGVSTLVLLIALISFITLPLFASAQATTTTSSTTATTTTNNLGDINAQIAALMEKIRLLKQQIVDLTSSIHDLVPGSNPGNSNASTTPVSSHARVCAHFARDLVAGSQGDDVRTLQEMLAEQGLLESDNTTGFFGPRTQAALARFQQQFSVGSSTGTFGPLTRGFLQRWCAKLAQSDTNATSTTWQLPPVPAQWTNSSTTWPGWNYPTTTWNYPPVAATGTNAWNNSSSSNGNPPIPLMRFQRGMSGEYIKKIQELLASRNDGTFTAEHVTGYFGPMTEEALKRFQASLGIDPLGFVGPQTLQKINEIITSSGLLNPTNNTELQGLMDQFRQMQQQMSNSSSSNTTFDLEHFKQLLGRIQGLRQNIPSSPGQNANSNSDQYQDTCGKIQCLVYQPVCGSDGRTYSCGTADANSCGVQVAHTGACQADNTGTGNPPVACTMDAMMCPDGSYVGRTGPSCTFVCPVSNTDN
jgi:peptidoglycan hydrolase-like protein with peptidoglycan-binding domain